MARITQRIDRQAYEIIRDRIGAILADEIANQATLWYDDADIAADVYVERWLNISKAQMPAVNVTLGQGMYSNQDIKSADGVYTFYIDCYHRGFADDGDTADQIATVKLHRLLGLCRAILEDTQYHTLGYAPGFIHRVTVSGLGIADNTRIDTAGAMMGRLEFQVKVSENVHLVSPVLLDGYDTSVKLGITDRGYVFSGNGSPLPPITCAPVLVENSDGSYSVSVDSGGTLPLPDTKIINSNGSYDVDQPSTIQHDLPDVTHTDSNGLPVVKPGMVPFVATPCGVPDPATITINSAAFGEFPSGETSNIDVLDEDGDPKGSKVGGNWEIANNDITDSDGSETEINAEEPFVCTPQMNADFEADNLTPTTLDVVTFTDLTNQSPTSWDYDFGDGNTSTLQNPTHTYDIPGVYTVKFGAYKADPFNGFRKKENYITVTAGTILDLVTGALAGYSLRKLKGTATAAVRVRRSSDNAEMDIGFNGNGVFDTATFSTFVGGGSGFVVTWYDQSGNGKNLTQSVAGNQPIINVTGLNSKSTIEYVSSDYVTAIGSVLGKPSNYTILSLLAVSNINSRQAAFGSLNAAGQVATAWGEQGNKLWNVTNGSIGYGFGDATNGSIGETSSGLLSNNTLFQISQKYTAGQTATQLWANGILRATTPILSAASSVAGTAQDFSVGRAGAFNGVYLTGHVPELIIYNSALNDTNRQIVEGSQQLYYNI